MIKKGVVQKDPQEVLNNLTNGQISNITESEDRKNLEDPTSKELLADFIDILAHPRESTTEDEHGR